MKEYLDPKDWSLKVIKLLFDRVPSDWIEVPEGAEVAKLIPGFKTVQFYKGRMFFSTTLKCWVPVGDAPSRFIREIVWKRPTQPEELPFADDEPPAYYGNAIRPKPRQRVYAVMGNDDYIRIPNLTADYLFNTVPTLGFVSDEQKGAILYHLNYLKVN